MLVRAARRRQRVPLIRAAVVAAVVLIPIAPLSAQQPAGSMPATHTVKRGDTLWDIAKTYLGDSFLWPEIYRLNTDVIEDPHWIYPGEVLKLSGITARVVAVTPPQAPTPPEPVPQAQPKPVEAPVVEAKPAPSAPVSRVRLGEYEASPWVDREGGPKGSGHVIQAVDLPATAVGLKTRVQLYDRIAMAPPLGSKAEEKERYLSYRLGPDIEDFGQIVIPTGIIEVTRTPKTGEAAIGRVVKMFGEVLPGQRLLPIDTIHAFASGELVPVSADTAKRGRVRWILNEPVLPSLQNYVVIDITRRDSIATGDRIELYKPRTPPTETQPLVLPEVFIGYAQVLRVTQYGATAIITSQEQPRIKDGTFVRINAKMP